MVWRTASNHLRMAFNSAQSLQFFGGCIPPHRVRIQIYSRRSSVHAQPHLHPTVVLMHDAFRKILSCLNAFPSYNRSIAFN